MVALATVAHDGKHNAILDAALFERTRPKACSTNRPLKPCTGRVDNRTTYSVA